jgi:hypothetical protein
MLFVYNKALKLTQSKGENGYVRMARNKGNFAGVSN